MPILPPPEGSTPKSRGPHEGGQQVDARRLAAGDGPPAVVLARRAITA
jgi:hypothetical protein